MPHCTAQIPAAIVDVPITAAMIDGSITAAWEMSMFQGQGQELKVANVKD